MTIKDVISIATEAVQKRFANSDWEEDAMEAAQKIAAGDMILAAKIARKSKKLPPYATDNNGVPSPFLWWKELGIKK